MNLNGTVEVLNQDKIIGRIIFSNKDISIHLNDASTIFSLFKNFFPGQYNENRETTKNKLPKTELNNISNLLISLNIKVTVFQDDNEILSIGRDVDSVVLRALGIKNVKIRNMAKLLNLYFLYKNGVLPLKEVELRIKDLNGVIKLQTV